MRLIAGLLAIAMLPAIAAADEGRSFVDSAGRSVQLPERVERVYAAGHPASILLYTLAPDTLLGWSRRLPAQAAEYMPERYFDLPKLGRLTGRGGTANVEVVLTQRPDLILDYGAVNPTFTSLADRVQAQTGIPYVLIDGTFTSLPEAYRRLGELLGRQQRAERLARYVEQTLAELERLRTVTPEAERARVYYGRGPDGLETGLRGSINVELLELIGAVNVAAAAGEGGLGTVSLEQVLAWRPDVILTIERRFYGELGRDPRWSALPAVQQGRVYLAPSLPFGWFDRPPSVNRLIGARWLVHVLHPGRADGTLEDEVRRFYELFYHHTLTPPQLEALLSGARGLGR
jgi:iron complex transport system substrate-binding protein